MQWWLEEMAAQPDAEDWVKRAAYPDGPDDEYEIRDWHGMYWEAWDILRYDRHYDGYGGEGPISYSVVRQYALDIGLRPDSQDFWLFRLFFSLLDSAHLQQRAEKRKAEEQKRKNDEVMAGGKRHG